MALFQPIALRRPTTYATFYPLGIVFPWVVFVIEEIFAIEFYQCEPHGNDKDSYRHRREKEKRRTPDEDAP